MALLEISAAELLAWRRLQLAEGGRAVDFDWLLDLGGGLRWSDLQQLYLDPRRSVLLERSFDQLAMIWKQHLDHHIPLQYLIGCCPWRDFELEVSAAALIPRQETELLVDFALQALARKPFGRWADLGTGSGALAVALSRALPVWRGHAVDCSIEALALAKRNLQRLAPHALWQLHQGSWWEPLRPWWGEFSLVLVNPPYIPEVVMAQLEPVVRDHEPHLALYGGADGLVATRQIIAGAMQALEPGGWLFLEHHHDQSDAVLALMRQQGLENVDYKSDLLGVRRFAIARHPDYQDSLNHGSSALGCS